jgi:hypothetical protein
MKRSIGMLAKRCKPPQPLQLAAATAPPQPRHRNRATAARRISSCAAKCLT